jgi:hypothetical protein
MAQLGAVVIPCASRKRWTVAPGLSACELPRGDQVLVAAEWMSRLRTAATQGDAKSLYMGRGFSLGASAAAHAAVPLFVVSAGLGVVAGTRAVPSYGLTVGTRTDDAIGPRMTGGIDSAAWWRTVTGGPFSMQWQSVVEVGGLVLIALSQAYAGLIAEDLSAMNPIDVRRMRFFGTGLDQVLPAALRSSIMPYDARLDALWPGTRTDFAQRALAHFAKAVVHSEDPADDAAAVSRALQDHRAPERIERPRAGDDVLIMAIRRHLRATSGIGRILRRLREQDQIACEQRRFTRLYHAAVQQGAVQ